MKCRNCPITNVRYMDTSGYSGTALAKKLGIKQDYKIKLVNPPDHYFDLFSDLPENVQQVSNTKSKKNLIHFFVSQISKLKAGIPVLKKEIESNGCIWVSWPKKASKIPTDVTEKEVRQIGLENGLVDIKVCAVDDIWSGLKFVIPLSDRQPI